MICKSQRQQIWVFPRIGVGPQNGWFIMKNHIKMDDLGVPLFLETSICFTYIKPISQILEKPPGQVPGVAIVQRGPGTQLSSHQENHSNCLLWVCLIYDWNWKLETLLVLHWFLCFFQCCSWFFSLYIRILHPFQHSRQGYASKRCSFESCSLFLYPCGTRPLKTHRVHVLLMDNILHQLTDLDNISFFLGFHLFQLVLDFVSIDNHLGLVAARMCGLNGLRSQSKTWASISSPSFGWETSPFRWKTAGF